LWVFGLGPFESRVPVRPAARRRRQGKQPDIGVSNHASDPLDAFTGSVVFQRAVERRPSLGVPEQPAADAAVQTASHSEPAKIDHQNVPLKPAAAPSP
jgi:hypothetical protein